MEINITGRNIDLDDDLKAYINKRLHKIERLYRRIYKCEVVLEEEKIRKHVEIILFLKRTRIIAKEYSADFYSSIDAAYENIKKQVRRLNDRLNTKRRKNVFSRFLGSESSTDEDSDISESYSTARGDIIKTDLFADKPMMPDEAKLELDLSDQGFIMFKNAETGESNVIYKKDDCNYGLIEPRF